MPERSWGGGSSGSSSSSSSSSSHSSSSSSSSSYHHDNYYNNNDGDGSSDSTWGWVWLGIIAVFVIGWILISAGQKISEKNNNANATATTHAITLSDLAMMHAAIDAKLPRWRELAGITPTHVSAEAAGFASDTNTGEVVYGYCDASKQTFYLYVLNEAPPQGVFFADTEGYAYINGSNPTLCHPTEWNMQDYVRVTEEANWYFAIMRTNRPSPYSTEQPYTATPVPTPTSHAF